MDLSWFFFEVPLANYNLRLFFMVHGKLCVNWLGPISGRSFYVVLEHLGAETKFNIHLLLISQKFYSAWFFPLRLLLIDLLLWPWTIRRPVWILRDIIIEVKVIELVVIDLRNVIWFYWGEGFVDNPVTEIVINLLLVSLCLLASPPLLGRLKAAPLLEFLFRIDPFDPQVCLL